MTTILKRAEQASRSALARQQRKAHREAEKSRTIQNLRRDNRRLRDKVEALEFQLAQARKRKGGRS